MAVSTQSDIGSLLAFADRCMDAGIGRALRLAVGMTIADVAHEVDTTATSVGRWERGEVRPIGRNRREYAALLWRIAQALEDVA